MGKIKKFMTKRHMRRIVRKELIQVLEDNEHLHKISMHKKQTSALKPVQKQSNNQFVQTENQSSLVFPVIAEHNVNTVYTEKVDDFNCLYTFRESEEVSTRILYLVL